MKTNAFMSKRLRHFIMNLDGDLCYWAIIQWYEADKMNRGCQGYWKYIQPLKY